MSQVITYSRFWLRRGTADEWNAANPTLHAAEIGIEQAPLDSPPQPTRMKIGDGVTAWNDLDYAALGAVDFSGIADGEVPTWNAAAGKFIMAAGGGGGGAMTLLNTATVTGAPATTLAVSGLSLAAYKAFRVIATFKNATAGSADLSLYFNADTTATNYNIQYIYASGGSLLAGAINSGVITTLDASAVSSCIMDIVRDGNNHPRTACESMRGATVPATLNVKHIWTGTADITDITISSSVGGALSVGDTISVFGIN